MTSHAVRPPNPHDGASTTPGRTATSGAGQPAIASSATRHLCAAAYLDDSFRRDALEEVLHQPARPVAPSYGFDLITVLGHCLKAERVALIRDGVLVGVLFFLVCFLTSGALIAFTALVGLYLARSIWQLWSRYQEQRRWKPAGADGALSVPALLVRVVTAGILFLVLLAALGAVVYLSQQDRGSALDGGSWTGSDGFDENGFYEDGFAIEEPPSAAGSAVFGAGAAFALLLVFGVPVGASLWRLRLLQRLRPGNVPRPPGESRRFVELRRQERGNTTVYSGYWPFLGAGYVLRTWGFAQRLIRAESLADAARQLASPPGRAALDAELPAEAEREFTKVPFTADELVGHLRTKLSELTDAPVPEHRIPGLTVTDRVFLASTEVGHRSHQTSSKRMLEIIRNPTAPARHYLVCQVISWRGELVTTVYVHVAVQGRSLYLEFTSAALPPCDERYRVVDQLDFLSRTEYLRTVGAALLDAPQTVGRAPYHLLRAGWHELLRADWAGSRQRGDQPAGYDFGARFSVRERGSAKDTRNHIQTQEILKYQRIIERRLLAAVFDFLQDHDVDITEYRQRALTVLNSGNMNFGSNSGGMGNTYGDRSERTGDVR